MPEVISILRLLENAGMPAEKLQPTLTTLMSIVRVRNCEPSHLRSLLERAQMSRYEAARIIEIDAEELQSYLTGVRQCPYPIQYCLEVLATIAAKQ